MSLNQDQEDQLRLLVQQAGSLLGLQLQSEQLPPSESSSQAPSDDELSLGVPAEIPQPDLSSEVIVAWGNRVTPVFIARVVWMADDLSIGTDPIDGACKVMSCMAFESGESFRADKKNPASSATGLIQFMDATAAQLGTTTRELAAMKPEDQIFWVWKYFNMFTRSKSKGSGGTRTLLTLEDLYMTILWPKAIGAPLSTPIFLPGTAAYRVNAGLDANHDGAITKGEAAAKVLEKYNAGMKAPNVWQGVLPQDA